MTSTEKFVYKLCNKTFLSLWSFPNPLGKKGKELCDVIVVCQPDIIIFSVKDIKIKASGDFNLDVKRWIERAITSSVKQIYGAERYINSVDSLRIKDSSEIIILKEISWNIHRIAVGFGRGDNFPLQYGDFGKGFVHVFDEKSVEIILSELDTTKDFINYLQAKENLINNDRLPMNYGEEDMLAFYLSNNFSFPEFGDYMVFSNDIYNGLRESKHYQKILDDLKVSYFWDDILERLIRDFNDNILLNAVTRDELELTIRQMAREDRNSRKFLSEQFLDFIGVNKTAKSNARIIQSLDNKSIIYLFLTGDENDRERRSKELQLRSFVARSICDCTTIIGLATDKYNPLGYSLEFSYIYLPEFTEKDRIKAKDIIDDLGYFKNAVQRKI